MERYTLAGTIKTIERRNTQDGAYYISLVIERVILKNDGGFQFLTQNVSVFNDKLVAEFNNNWHQVGNKVVLEGSVRAAGYLGKTDNRPKASLNVTAYSLSNLSWAEVFNLHSQPAPQPQQQAPAVANEPWEEELNNYQPAVAQPQQQFVQQPVAQQQFVQQPVAQPQQPQPQPTYTPVVQQNKF